MTLIKVNTRGSEASSVGGQPKNLLLNGAMDVCQRTGHLPGTVETGVISGSNYPRIDRWNVGGNGGSSGIDCSIVYHELGTGFATTNFKNAMRFNVSSASSSLSADNYVYTQQRIETKNVINRLNYGSSNAKKLTLSFWVYSDVTGKYGVGMINRKDASVNYRRRNIMSYNINAANTWEKKTITFVGDTDSNFGFDLTRTNVHPYLGVYWTFAAGSNRVASASSDYTSEGVWYTDNHSNGVEFIAPAGQANAFTSTSNDFYITGCQLEEGEIATDFEHRHHSQTLNDCYRYMYVYVEDQDKGDVSQGRMYSGSYASSGSMIKFPYPCVMYKNPSLTYTQAAGAMSSNYSNPSMIQLYDSDDTAWRIHNVVADAEIS